MSECTHNCDTCSSNCSSKANKIEKLKLSKGSSIKKVIGISSGKGGVGKSFVTSVIASMVAKKGYKVGILDADILGPSIPKAFGIIDRDVIANEDGFMIPKTTNSGIKVMSSNLLLPDDTSPIIYRGALLVGVLEQFYRETFWGDLDFLFIDMPPGTGDIPLSVYQSIPIDKVIIVSSPQSLVSMIVEKSINMADMMNIDILALVENMSYVVCNSCNEKIEIFGKSNVEKLAHEKNIDTVSKLPMKTEYVRMVDEGMVDDIDIEELSNVVDKIGGLLKCSHT